MTHSFIERQTGCIQRLLLLSAFFWLSLSHPNHSLAQGATSASGDVNVMSFQSGHSIVAEDVSRARLMEDHPSRMRAAAAMNRTLLEARCNGRRGAVREFAHDFTIDAAAFNAALGLSAMIGTGGDPAAFRHFFERSIIDPMAHVSFAAFMMANRGTANFFSMIGASYDPCRVVRRLPPGAPVPEATRMQRLFTPLIGPMGMAMGMIVSSSLHELLVDPNIQTCAKAWIGKATDEAAVARACDKAYEDWVIDRTIRQYIPDIFSMTASMYVAAGMIHGSEALIRAGAGGASNALDTRLARHFIGPATPTNAGTQQLTRYAIGVGVARTTPAKRVVLQGVRVVLGFGKHFVLPRWMSMIGNIMLFTDIQERITPYIKDPMETDRMGGDLTKQINDLQGELDKLEKSGWVRVPELPPSYCDSSLMSMNPEFNIFPFECLERTPLDIPKTITMTHEKYLKFRRFLLGEMFASVENWTSYAAGFTNIYNNSYNFYKDLTLAIYNKNKGEPIEVSQRSLFEPAHFNGLNVDLSNGVCQIDDRSKEAVSTALAFVSQTINERSPRNQSGSQDNFRVNDSQPTRLRAADEMQNLAKIRDGLLAFDCARPLPEAEAAIQSIKSTGMAMSESDETRVRNRARWVRAMSAFNTVDEVLSGRGFFKVGDLQPGTSAWEAMERENPFARLRTILGQRTPLPAGIAYIRQSENNPALINQDMKTQHPDTLRTANTPGMTDYMLASMVCGPNPNPSDAVKLRLVENSRRSWAGRVLAFFGLSPNRRTENGMVVINREADAEAVRNAINAPPSLFAFFENGRDRSLDVTLIRRTKSWGVDFRPPAIIKSLGVDFCVTYPENQRSDLLRRSNRAGDSTHPTLIDIHTGKWRVGDRTYEGFTDILKNNLDPAIVGESGYNFPIWWSQFVDPHVKTSIDVLRADYIKIVYEKFLPKLKRNTVERYNGRLFATGVSNSMLEEARFHLELIAKGHMANLGRPLATGEDVLAFSQGQADVDKYTLNRRLRDVHGKMDSVLKFLAKDGEPPTFDDYQKLREELTTSIQDLHILVQPESAGESRIPSNAREEESSRRPPQVAPRQSQRPPTQQRAQTAAQGNNPSNSQRNAQRTSQQRNQTRGQQAQQRARPAQQNRNQSTARTGSRQQPRQDSRTLGRMAGPGLGVAAGVAAASASAQERRLPTAPQSPEAMGEAITRMLNPAIPAPAQRPSVLTGPAKENVKAMQLAALRALTGLVTELDSYFGVLDSMKIDRLN